MSEENTMTPLFSDNPVILNAASLSYLLYNARGIDSGSLQVSDVHTVGSRFIRVKNGQNEVDLLPGVTEEEALVAVRQFLGTNFLDVVRS